MGATTFAHAIRVSVKLTVLHAWDEVKQSKDLLLGERGPRGHHQRAGELALAVVHHGVVPLISCSTKKQKQTR